MKIIFSRKGFDSSTRAGGVASPLLLPGGVLCSLPIPAEAGDKGGRRYNEIHFGAASLGKLVQDLTPRGRKIMGDAMAHLDPDLRRDSVPRREGWKPLFGQAGAAESHLRNCQVGPGDIFLFFGWFRAVNQIAETYKYVYNAPNRHIIFGWLQVDQRIPINESARIPTWAQDHPHVARNPKSLPDSLYIATDQLTLPGIERPLPGGGMFKRIHSWLCLSTNGDRCSRLDGGRSLWRLPAWFHPGVGRPPLTYHSNPRRWTLDGNYVYLQTVGRGQEFVLDCDSYPEAIGWLARLFNTVPVVE